MKRTLIIAFLITGCSTSEITSRQSLPISAQIKVNNQIINLEVAETVQEKATGLMHRTSLPENRGMLFKFEPAQKLTFWMKNCKIPLDMVFMKDGIVKAIVAEAPPCTTEPCPDYAPNMPIDQVIELNGGQAKKLSINVGNQIDIIKLN